MKSLVRAASALLLAVACTAGAAPASAEDAARRFAAAQKLYDDGSYAPALEEFKALGVETGSPNADLYVARCLRELGRLPEAYEAMTIALRNATAKADKDARYAETRKAAANDLALLDRRVAKLIVAVASPPAGLEVTVGGAPLPAEKLGVPVAQAAGEAVVHLRAPGRVDVERLVPLKAGETATLTVALESTAPAVPLEPVPRLPVIPPAATTGGGTRVAGFVTLGLGAAGMATFAVAGVMANNRYDSLRAACGGARCTDPGVTSQIDAGRRLDVIADVGLGLGIAGLAAGALMVALGGPRAAASTESAPRVSAWATARGGGLGVLAAF